MVRDEEVEKLSSQPNTARLASSTAEVEPGLNGYRTKNAQLLRFFVPQLLPHFLFLILHLFVVQYFYLAYNCNLALFESLPLFPWFLTKL